ncbi:hypothetical protein E3T39_10990 [Cryobacterium suzukii]|uniref:Uncharacterized protein n=1 Tax=Cryobacterium suzukii TaxID=1259198 RepID=A0A4R9AE73_9MICO|nr:hypothetical protein [Cryobacterium suzukii]TFD58887.1 hypothetical protein E3T39_10990 [Cryobacterium suzukii]
MMIHRYWRIMLIAPVIGFLLGAGVFGVMAMGGNPHTRTGQTIGDVVPAILAYGALGLAVSIAALIGGFVLVGCLDRHLTKSSDTRTVLTALGAAGGVMIVGIVLAIVQETTGDDSWSYLLLLFSVVLAIVAGIVAAVLVCWAERRERTGPERVEHPLPSAWVDF